MFPPPFTNEFENNVGLFTEIGRPILRDWGPDRKQVVYLILRRREKDEREKDEREKNKRGKGEEGECEGGRVREGLYRGEGGVREGGSKLG